MTDMLTREQIDSIIEGMTGADIADQLGADKPAQIGPKAFDSAAKRQGAVNGKRAMELVDIKDFQYLAEKLNEVMSLDGPKADQPEGSPPSADTGE